MSLFGERLPNLVPAVGEKFSSRYGIELQEAVAVLFGLYGWQLAPLLGHLKPPPPVTPPFRFGLVNVPDRSSTHPGDRAIKKVLDGWNSSFFSLGEAFSRMELQDPSILPLLRTPVVGFSGDRLWCPDPYLLLVAASEGLFWRLRDLYAENIGPGEEFIALLGKPVFETYVADLFVALGRDDVEQSGKHGDELGLPDFWVRENGLLIVFEAKAGFLSERAKFSRDPDQIDNSIKKLIGKGQMAKAIQRLLETRPDLRHGLERVIPVLVVLDNSWGAPGLEARVNALANRPSQGAVVEQIHVTPVAELEFAGQWLRNRVFGRLLDWRRRYAPSGDVSLSELLTDFAGPKREATGLALSGFDAQEQARRRVQAVMNDVFDSYRKQFESKT